MGLFDHPSSSGSQPGKHFKIDWSKWFPPVTSRTFLSHYLPASGALSHTLYTVHLFSPNIISNLFPTGDLAVSNTILFNANVGLGFYVYFRRHLHRVSPWERVEFSVLTSTLFNFGSLLAAVLIKALFPAKSHTLLKSLVASTLSVYLLSRAYKYLGLLDNKTTRSSVSPARSPALVSKSRNGRSIASTSRAGSIVSVDVHSNADDMNATLPLSPLNVNQNNLPMTPSATNYSATEQSLSEFGEVSTTEDRQNYRYLHSFALNNLNQNRPAKDNILRRTTMKRSTKIINRKANGNTWEEQKMSPSMVCFVTPDASIKESEIGIYTPRLQQSSPSSKKEKTKKIIKRKYRKNDEEKLEKILDMIQWHGPLLLIPFVFGCFLTGTVPMINTLKLIFLR